MHSWVLVKSGNTLNLNNKVSISLSTERNAALSVTLNVNWRTVNYLILNGVLINTDVVHP